METSLFLARLIGPIFIGIGIGLFLNRDMYRTPAEEYSTELVIPANSHPTSPPAQQTVTQPRQYRRNIYYYVSFVKKFRLQNVASYGKKVV